MFPNSGAGDCERPRRGLSEDEVLSEDEAGIETSETVMNVPRDLVPKVRELIAKYQS